MARNWLGCCKHETLELCWPGELLLVMYFVHEGTTVTLDTTITCSGMGDREGRGRITDTYWMP